MFKKIILIAFLFFNIKSEYVFYKAEDQIESISRFEHDAIYPLVSKYQFPMSLCNNLENELGKQELEFLDNDEEKFIQSKLSGNLKLKFIPNVLYELLFIKFYLEEIDKSGACKDCYTKGILVNNCKVCDLTQCKDANEARKLYSKFCIKHNFLLGNLYFKFALGMNFKKLNLIYEWDENKYNNAVADLNNDEFTKEYHLVINNKILSYLLDINFFQNQHDLLNIIFKIVNQIKIIFDKLNPTDKDSGIFYHQTNCLFPKDLKRLLINFSDLRKISFLLYQAALCEYNAHSNGAWLLYRGTQPIKKDEILDSTIGNRKSHTISFGNSLLSGAFFDLGATAFDFIIIEHCVGYALKINKAKYRQKKIPYLLFFIPPESLIISLCGSGENFHARSRTYQFPFSGIVDGHTDLHIDHLLANRNTFSCAQQFEEILQNYINKNIIFLKNKMNFPIRCKL